jgi:hypothetical protein
MKKQILSEEFRRMQLLAGVINESQLDEGETWIDGIWGTGNYNELIHKIENIFQEGGNGASFKCFGKDFTITKTKGGRFLITNSLENFSYEALDIKGAFIAAKKSAGITNESQLDEKETTNELFGFGSKIEIPSKENKSKLVKVGTGDLVVYNPEYDNSGYARDNEGVYTIEKVKEGGVILKKAARDYQTNQGASSRDISGALVKPSSLAYYGKK